MVNRTIILGSTGTIGKALSDYFTLKRVNCLRFNRSGGDNVLIFDVERMSSDEYLPELLPSDTLFLCFGLTDLDYVEENRAKSTQINVNSQIEIITSALNAGARVVFLSSEQVFSSKNGKHQEHSIPEPMNEYGRQKILVENFVKQQGGRWVIVRIGSLVVSSVGANCLVEKTYRSMSVKNGRMATDNFFSLTPIDFVIRGLTETLNGTFDRKTVHLVSNVETSRYHLAEQIRFASRHHSISSYRPCLFSELDFRSRRPRAVCLISENDWVLKNLDKSLINIALKEKVRILDDILGPKK